MKAEIGIIGGMGPMASELFYKMVTDHTKAEKDQDHINMIILSDTSIPDRTEAILNNDYEDVRNQMLEDALFLQNSGCKAIAVTCNTAHFFIDMIQHELQIPVLHMIHLTVAHLEKICAKGERIGIMATDGTIQTRLYQSVLEEKGFECYTPEDAIQKEVMHQIYDRIKCGKNYDEQSWKRISASYRDAGCSRVVMACTELSVLKTEAQLSDWYIDPMVEMAHAAIDVSGRTWID